MLEFVPIILLLFFLMHLAIILRGVASNEAEEAVASSLFCVRTRALTFTWTYIRNDNYPQVVTVRILTFLGGCIPERKLVNICELKTGNEATMDFVEQEIASLQFSWPSNQESLHIMPA